jgi:hypothetical protein
VGVLGGHAVVSDAKHAHPQRVVIGGGSFTNLPRGKKSAVKLTLNASGRTLLGKAHGKLKATITVTYRSGGRRKSNSTKVKLVSRKKHH